MRFIGIDLAWSERNSSAGAVIHLVKTGRGKVIPPANIGGDEEIIGFVKDAAGDEGALVAIDAPLIVPNERGSRPVDRLITKLFGRFDAGAYPANRSRMGGRVRGEEIVHLLEELGFYHHPLIEKQEEMRQVFEVYPHPAMLSLFGLDRTLKYKARKGRSYEYRIREFERFREHLRSLAKAEPGVVMPADLINRDLEGMRGRALKDYEDLLDAILCAYIAYYCWYWGPERYEIYGDMETGYIVVPTSFIAFGR
jgi:predicted RNase H-like nuclease